VNIELIDFPLNASQTDRFPFHNPDDDLVRQNTLDGGVSHPAQLFDAAPHLFQVHAENVCTGFEARPRNHVVFCNTSGAGNRKFLNVKPRRRSDVNNNFVGAPAEDCQAGDGHHDLSEADEPPKSHLHAVLEKRWDSVSDSLVTLPAPITTTASP